MGFENDAAIQKAMRHFSSAELAKIILHDRKMRDAFKRNMVEGCWQVIQEYLDNREFCEQPQEVFNRFVKEYQTVAGMQE